MRYVLTKYALLDDDYGSQIITGKCIALNLELDAERNYKRKKLCTGSTPYWLIQKYNQGAASFRITLLIDILMLPFDVWMQK